MAGQPPPPEDQTGAQLRDAPASGGQSPPPEEQTGAQLHDAPASGHGIGDASNKEETNKGALEKLGSNLKGPLEDAAKAKVEKTVSEELVQN